MEQINNRPYRQNQEPRQNKIFGVYIASILTKKVILSINEIGTHLKHNLERTIAKTTEGRCIKEGFIKRGSTKIIKYSCGNINGDKIEFQTVFECMIAHPVEKMLIECTAKTITKAGVHAEVVDPDGTVPIVVFITRDHHFKDKQFLDIQENMKLLVKVVGVRFELNDPQICVIGQLAEYK